MNNFVEKKNNNKKWLNKFRKILSFLLFFGGLCGFFILFFAIFDAALNQVFRNYDSSMDFLFDKYILLHSMGTLLSMVISLFLMKKKKSLFIFCSVITVIVWVIVLWFYFGTFFEAKNGKVKLQKCKESCELIDKIEDENNKEVDEIGIWHETPSCISECMGYVEHTGLGKPVIYFYPEEVVDIKVELKLEGEIIADYPDYDYSINGWEVTAYPDGHLVNKKDNKEYSYIFWEGITGEEIDFDLTKGFIVKGSDVKVFLQNKLSEIGLTPKEYNEFIVYWYPKMMNNEYNLIHFAGVEYTEKARLNIEPGPDSLLRVFMVYKSINEPIELEEQKFPVFDRHGFTVVEWGGTEIY